jgi:hypothetical protein
MNIVNVPSRRGNALILFRPLLTSSNELGPRAWMALWLVPRAHVVRGPSPPRASDHCSGEIAPPPRILTRNQPLAEKFWDPQLSRTFHAELRTLDQKAAKHFSDIHRGMPFCSHRNFILICPYRRPSRQYRIPCLGLSSTLFSKPSASFLVSKPLLLAEPLGPNPCRRTFTNQLHSGRHLRSFVVDGPEIV